MSRGHSSGQAGAGEALALAAAPTFAAMALLTEVLADPSALCLSAPAGPAGPLNAMATMYLLMSLFHAPAWLRRIRGAAGPAGP